MRKHVILIDEGEYVLQILKEAFIQTGAPYKCTWAKSGVQAVQQITYLLPDIVLLNVNMQGQDVFTTIDAIRRIKHAALTPIIVYWFGLNNQSYLKELLPGSTAYLKKCDREELIEALNKHLLQTSN